MSSSVSDEEGAVVKCDLTEGSSLRGILRFAFPLLLGNLFQQTYNVIDAAIVGRYLGASSFASIGVSTSVQFFIFGWCNGAMNGFGIPVAASFGARREDELKRYVYNGGGLALSIAVLMTSLTVAFCGPILRLIETPAEIYEEAYSYLVVIFAGIPFTILYNYLAGLLRAIGDSHSPFVYLAISSVVNIVLDLVCIVGLGMGVEGAALATIVSQSLSGLLCILCIRKKYRLLHVEREYRRLEVRRIVHLLTMGLPMGLHLSIIALGSMVMQAANNSLGTVYVSGFAAASRIKIFAMAPFDALGVAVSTFMSQNFGAQKLDRIRHGFKIGALASFSYGVVSGLVLVFLGRVLSMLFISSEEHAVLDASAMYLRFMGAFYWTFSLQIVIRSCVQGLGYSGRAMIVGVLEMILRIVVAFVYVKDYGVTAICAADPASWLLALFYIAPTAWFCFKAVERKVHEAALTGGDLLG